MNDNIFGDYKKPDEKFGQRLDIDSNRKASIKAAYEKCMENWQMHIEEF